MDNDYEDRIIPGSDVVMSCHQAYIPFGPVQDSNNPWLPKTDWSRDGIIANGQE